MFRLSFFWTWSSAHISSLFTSIKAAGASSAPLCTNLVLFFSSACSSILVIVCLLYSFPTLLCPALCPRKLPPWNASLQLLYLLVEVSQWQRPQQEISEQGGEELGACLHSCVTQSPSEQTLQALAKLSNTCSPPCFFGPEFTSALLLASECLNALVNYNSACI